MKAFHSTRKLFGSLGIYRLSSPQNHLFEWKILFVFILFGQYIISLMAFFLFEANTLSEFTASYYAVATTTLLFFTSISMFRKKMDIFQLLDNFENVIEQRQSILKIHLKC